MKEFLVKLILKFKSLLLIRNEDKNKYKLKFFKNKLLLKVMSKVLPYVIPQRDWEEENKKTEEEFLEKINLSKKLSEGTLTESDMDKILSGEYDIKRPVVSFQSLAKNYTKQELVAKAEKCNSFAEMSRELHCSIRTLKKYLKMYEDDETGLNLLKKYSEIMKTRPKNTGGIYKIFDHSAKTYGGNHVYPEKIDDILEGKYEGYPTSILRKRILKWGNTIIKPECSECGYNKRKPSNKCYPLLLDYKDGNYRNSRLENLRLLCLNCYFIHVRNPNMSYQGFYYK